MDILSKLKTREALLSGGFITCVGLLSLWFVSGECERESILSEVATSAVIQELDCKDKLKVSEDVLGYCEDLDVCDDWDDTDKKVIQVMPSGSWSSLASACFYILHNLRLELEDGVPDAWKCSKKSYSLESMETACKVLNEYEEKKNEGS